MTDSVTELLGRSFHLFAILLCINIVQQGLNLMSWLADHRSSLSTQMSFLVSGKSTSRVSFPLLLDRISHFCCFQYSDTIQQDKAAVLVYLRMRHKDPYRGYVLCGVVGAILTSLPRILSLIVAPFCPSPHSLGSFVSPLAVNFTFGKEANVIPRSWCTELSSITSSLEAYHLLAQQKPSIMPQQRRKSPWLPQVHTICRSGLDVLFWLYKNFCRQIYSAGTTHLPCHPAQYPRAWPFPRHRLHQFLPGRVRGFPQVHGDTVQKKIVMHLALVSGAPACQTRVEHLRLLGLPQ